MDWEEKFKKWGAAPGKTEEEKASNAENAVREAIENSSYLKDKDILVLPQGSYKNKTNIGSESDVDIGVICRDCFFFELPSGMTPSDFGFDSPAPYGFKIFKDDVEKSLVDHFGRSAVERGNKAFDIHENSYRTDADVVSCFEYRRYHADGSCIKGVAFDTDSGIRIINWPAQNYSNGVDKNKDTDYGFKPAVRILKNLKYEMIEKGYKEAEHVASFLCECLVWNVPNDGLKHATYTEDIRYTLAHLFNNTIKVEDSGEWGEVNELKYLFRTSQPWTLNQAHAFISTVWDYIGFE